MTARLRRFPALVALVVAAGLPLAACSSGGASSTPSQSQIESKLKSDSAVTAQIDQLGTVSSKLKDAAYTCIAKVMREDAPASDVRAYVDGKESLQQVGQDKSDSKLTSDLKTCLTNKVQG